MTPISSGKIGIIQAKPNSSFRGGIQPKRLSKEDTPQLENLSTDEERSSAKEQESLRPKSEEKNSKVTTHAFSSGGSNAYLAPELKKRSQARKYFNLKKYHKALKLYRELDQVFPKDEYKKAIQDCVKLIHESQH